MNEQDERVEPVILPRRAVVMNLRIQADTREDLARALEQIATDIDLGYINGPGGCSGGTRSGHSYEFSASDRPTHDEYFEQLDVYLAKKG